MADCSSYEEAVHADELGFDFIGTALIGYTNIAIEFSDIYSL